jgi:membrane dipeptidase
MVEGFHDPQMRKLLRETWEYGGVDCIFQNCGEESNDVERLIKRLGNYTRTIDYCTEVYERCPFVDRLEGIRSRGNKALYITTNGVPVSSKFISSDENMHLIETFFNLGVRMMHLTYNRRNLIGDGCAEPANGGLSDFGRMVIAEMNRVGVIPDVAQNRPPLHESKHGSRADLQGNAHPEQFPNQLRLLGAEIPIYMGQDRDNV